MTEDLLIFNANIRTMDAGGRLVLPGFQDAHIHLLNGGIDLVETAQLYHVTTIAGLQSALKARAGRTGFSARTI